VIALESIETIIVRLPERADFRWLSLSRPLGEFVLARVTADGVEGWGEVVGLRDWGDIDGRRHGETPETIAAIVHEQLAPLLLSEPLGVAEIRPRVDRHVVGHPYAKALVEMAALDLAGRVSGVPVHALLGGRVRDRVPVAHMIGLMDHDEAVEEASAAIADGVRALQVKGGQSIRRDIELIRQLRDRLGDDVLLRLDANGGYRPGPEARRALAELADAGANYVEQPVFGLDALADITATTPIPIIADEACWTPADALELVARRAVNALSIYVGKAGGVRNARDMGAIAAAARMPHDVNGALELGIGNAANVHLALATPADLLACVIPVNAPAGSHPGTTAGRYFEDDIIAAPFAFEDGALLALDEAGLGVTVDTEKVDHYAVHRHVSTARTAVEVAT
jgi:L-alanine-DL-glutamate epimerase-like enolase superfamily enzyme